MNRRNTAFWVGLLGVIVLIALVAGPAKSGAPLDPRSSQGNGTKALVLLLRHFGATVDVTADAPGSDVDVTLVLKDELSDARRQDLARWARAGGTLVVADPTSPLQVGAPVSASTGLVTRDQVEGPCPAAGFDDVHRISTGGSDLLRLPGVGGADSTGGGSTGGGGTGGAAGGGAVGCFPGRPGTFLLVTAPVQQGRLTELGGAGMFTNSLLDHEDNSVLAVDLLLIRPGAHVRFMLRSPVGSGGRSLFSLVRPSVRLALVQLAIAFVIVAFWRGRRFGRPVADPHPVELAGSELVVAVGELLARTGRQQSAAGLLRQDLRRSLAARLGLPRHAPPNQIADAACARTGIERARLLALLEDRPVANDTELLEPGPVDRTAPSGGHPCLRPPRRRRATPYSPSVVKSPRSWSARRGCSPAWSPRCSSAATSCSRACPV